MLLLLLLLLLPSPRALSQAGSDDDLRRVSLKRALLFLFWLILFHYKTWIKGVNGH
jgi:hypothetical protein